MDPLGIDAPNPGMSWIIESAERGERQTAYRILVASSPSKLDENTGDLWDSEKVMSGQSVSVPYAGADLASGSQAFWKVKVWSTAGKESDWSDAGMWSMGLLEAGDWKQVAADVRPFLEQSADAGLLTRDNLRRVLGWGGGWGRILESGGLGWLGHPLRPE